MSYNQLPPPTSYLTSARGNASSYSMRGGFKYSRGGKPVNYNFVNSSGQSNSFGSSENISSSNANNFGRNEIQAQLTNVCEASKSNSLERENNNTNLAGFSQAPSNQNGGFAAPQASNFVSLPGNSSTSQQHPIVSQPPNVSQVVSSPTSTSDQQSLLIGVQIKELLLKLEEQNKQAAAFNDQIKKSLEDQAVVLKQISDLAASFKLAEIEKDRNFSSHGSEHDNETTQIPRVQKLTLTADQGVGSSFPPKFGTGNMQINPEENLLLEVEPSTGMNGVQSNGAQISPISQSTFVDIPEPIQIVASKNRSSFVPIGNSYFVFEQIYLCEHHKATNTFGEHIEGDLEVKTKPDKTQIIFASTEAGKKDTVFWIPSETGQICVMEDRPNTVKMTGYNEQISSDSQQVFVATFQGEMDAQKFKDLCTSH